MKQIFYFMLMGLLAISCTQNKSSNKDSAVEKDAGIAIAEGKSCYLSVVSKDSAKLEIDRQGKNFKGFLYYKRFESDSSLGEIVGTISGDTLKGTFNFLSEGIISEREVYFLYKDGKLAEGFGNIVQVSENAVKFENPAELEYDSKFAFNLTDCANNFISQSDKDFYRNFKK